MRLMLHACCGPCVIEPLDSLTVEHDVVAVYANPNIHPLSEHARRLDTLAAYLDDQDVELSEVAYDPASWVRAVAGLQDDVSARCAACYRLRLGQVAALAAERGFDAIATTLTVSPYQDPEAIRRAGREAAAAEGIEYVDTDFRPRYRSAVERSREIGMYRQRYCGCVLSEVEAERERAERRARHG